METNDQLKAMKSIRKPMPKPSVIIKNKKKDKLDKIGRKEQKNWSKGRFNEKFEAVIKKFEE